MSYGINGWWKSCGATVVVFVLVAMMAGHRYTAHGLSQTDTTKLRRPTQKDQHRWVGFFWKAAADKNNSQASRWSLGGVQERHAPVVFSVTAISRGKKIMCGSVCPYSMYLTWQSMGPTQSVYGVDNHVITYRMLSNCSSKSLRTQKLQCY